MPKIYKSIDIPHSNTGYIYRQDNKSDMLIYAIQNGKVVQYKFLVEQGTYDSTEFLSQDIEAFQYDLTNVTGDLLEDYVLFLFKGSKGINIAMYPQVTDKFVYDDEYRLYWGYDTKKLYMNICNSWEMIGTLRHELMDNVGTLTHDEIEAKLKSIEEALSGISKPVSTLNGINGDVLIKQDENITITNDKATNSITIKSKDTITSVNEFVGPVVIEAGDNVSVTKGDGNKLIISAAGSDGLKVPQNLTVTTWVSSSRKPRSFGGIYTFKKDVEITAVTTHDDISAMTDAVLLVYRQVPYEMLKALISNTDTSSSIYIDTASVAPSQYIPIANIGNISVKVNSNEVVAFIIYSPSGKIPATFSYGGYDTNAALDKARCLVASDGTTNTFMTAGDGYPEAYSLILTFKA